MTVPIGRRTIIAHELIGLRVVITASHDPTLVGLTGIVRDETKNTLRIEAGGKIKTVAKHGTTFQVEFSSRDVAVIDGERLTFRPEDRVKKGLESWL